MVLIQKADVSYVEQIVSISTKLIRTNPENKSGSFLIRPLDNEMVKQNIHQFYVAILEGNLVGYIWINSFYPKIREEHTTFSESIDLSEVIYIKQVSVHPDYARKGIASQLYSYIQRNFPNNNSLACIAVSPLKNEPSIHLHKKFGFRKVGVLELFDYLGFEQYIADVYLHEN